ncbi:PAS domain S-box protein [candidate division WOR-3 bacterium]|nr:PAS domain S-box protein [candidate division WOR-3 bacterium]
MASARILIVEDEIIVAKNIEKCLVNLGYQASRVLPSPQEVFDKIKENKINLVLMDIRLKGEIDGIQLAEIIRDKYKIPVVYLTAYADREILERAKASEPYGYVVKPFDEQKLEVAIEMAKYRHEMERKLEKSEERYALTTSAGKIGVWDLNLETNEMYIDPSLKALLGYHDDEIRNHLDDWNKYIHPDERENVKTSLKEHLEGKIPRYEAEYRMIHKDGSIRWILARGTVMRDENGKPYRMIGTDIDITERKLTQDALLQTEQRYRSLQANIPVGVFRSTPKGELISVNPSMVKMLGYESEDELLLVSAVELYHRPEQREELIRQLSTNGIVTGFEALMQRKDGSVFWATLDIKALTDEKNNWIYQDGILVDITERKRTEEALRESEDKYRTTIDSMADPIHVVDSDLKIVLFNQAFQRWNERLGLEKDALGKKIFELFPFLSDKIRLEYLGVFESGETLVTEEKTEIDGNEYVTETRKIPILNEGLVHRIVTVIHDITDRKRAEEALRKSEERLSATLNALPDLLFEVDSNGVIYDYRVPETIMLYAEPEDFLGKSLREVLPPQASDVIIGAISQAVEKGWHSGAVYSLDMPDGLHWYDLSIAIKGNPRMPEGRLITIARDITERKKAEETLRESEERYKTLFEDSPISLWEEDLSGIKAYIDQLKAEGVVNFREYFEQYPEEALRWSELEKVIDVNRATLNLYGAGCKEELIEDMNRILCEESLPALKDQLIAIAEGKTSFQSESVNMTLKGERKNISIRLTIAPGYEEFLSKVLISIVDITERKLAEEALRTSQQRLAEANQMLQLAFDTVPVRIFWKDRNSVYLGCNQLFALDAGREKPSDLIGHNDYEMGWQEQADLYRKDDAEVMSSGMPKINYEEPQTTPDGRTIWLRTSKVPLRNLDGTVIGVLGTYEDITERKKVEEALRNSERDKAAILSSITEHVVYHSTEMKIMWANRAAADSLGLEPEDLIGKRCYELWPIKDIICDGCPVFKALQTGKVHEAIQKTPDGRVWFVKGYPVKDEAGNVIAMVETTLEITKRNRAEETLRESEEKYRSLFEKSPTAITLVDKSGIVIDCNTSTEELTGYSKEEIIGKQFKKLMTLDPEDIPQLQKKFEVLTIGQEIEPYELEIIRKNGERRWINVINSLLMKENEIVGFQIIATDVTDRMKAEEALRESEEKYRNLVERANDGITIIADAEIKYANRKLLEILGYREDELVNKPFATFIAPDERPRVKENYKKRMAGEDLPSVYETALIDKDGTRIEVELNVGLITYMNKPAELVFVRDITERKKAEEALRESEERYRSLVRTSPDAIALANLEGVISYVSPQAVTLYGYENPDEMVGLSPLDMVAPEDREKVKEVMNTLLEKGEITTWEMEHRRKNGTTFIGESSAAFIKDASGNPTGIVAATRDITERKKAEAVLKATMRRNQALLQAMPDMMFVLTRDGTYVDFESDRDDHLAMPRNEIIGKNIRDTGFSDETVELIGKSIEKALNTGLTQSLEYELMTPIGLGYYEARIVPLTADEVLATVRDVTVKVIQNRQIEQTKLEWERTFDATSDLIAILGLKRQIVRANRAAAEYAHLDMDELIGRTCFDLFHLAPDDQSCPEEVCISTKKTQHAEFTDPVTKRVFLISVSPLLDDENEVIGIVDVARDISMMRNIEAALMQSEAQFRGLAESVEEIIFSVDNEGRFKYLNPAVKTILGFKPAELTGKEVSKSPLLDFILWDSINKDLFPGREQIPLFETEVKDTHGSKHIFEISARRLPGQIVGVARDVTERKRMEQQLIRSSKLASIGVLAAGIAHQVNNPLAIMVLSTTALKDLLTQETTRNKDLCKKASKYLETLNSQIERTRKVVSDLLAFTQEKPSMTKPTDINSIVKESIQFMSQHLSKETLSLKLDLCEDLPKASVDPVAVQQVIVNVIENSIDAMKQVGKIDVTTALIDDEFIRIIISDTGPGIPPQIRDEIFDPLFSTKTAAEGTGLGLPLSVVLLERFGGRIYLEDTPAPGARFVIEVPLIKEANHET